MVADNRSPGEGDDDLGRHAREFGYTYLGFFAGTGAKAERARTPQRRLMPAWLGALFSLLACALIAAIVVVAVGGPYRVPAWVGVGIAVLLFVAMRVEMVVRAIRGKGS